MPYKPKRPCRWFGCNKLTDGVFCDEHKKQSDILYNKYQRSCEHKARYDNKWRKISDRYIKAHPMCEECLKFGRLTASQETHHIIPLSKGGTHAEENLMALCKPCHSRISAENGDRWGNLD